MRAPRQLALTCVSMAASLVAQGQQDAASLASMDLEKLLATPVTTVRRKEESLSRAAGAVFVITQEELRRFGVSSIPEALRLVPGLYVARVGLSSWSISARGFNNIYSNKLLVMMDGRTLYTPLFGGVFWDSQDTLIEDIDRIEVLRGPGAAMWGANAVNGVINIITKPAQRTQGTLVTVGTGSEDAALVRVRYGAAAGKKGYFRAYGQQTLRLGAGSADPAFGDARWSMAQGGFRGDWTLSESDTLTIQGDVYRSGVRSYPRLPSLSPPFFDVTTDRPEALGGNVLSRWEHTHRSGGLSVLQTYFDSYQRTGDTANLGVRTGDLEYLYRHPAMGRHELSIGIGNRSIWDRTLPSQYLNFTTPNEQYGIQHVTIGDDLNLITGRLALTAAVRIEHNTFTGWTAQPTVRLLYTPTAKHTFWSALSRAVRTPSRGELGASVLAKVIPTQQLPIAVEVFANPGLRNEVGTSAEWGYRGQFFRRLAFDGTFFASRMSQLMNFQAGPLSPQFTSRPPYLLLPLSYRNQIAANSQGIETAVRFAASSKWQLSGALTWLQFSRIAGAGNSPIDPTSLISASPGRQFYLRSEWNPARRWDLDLSYFWYGPRLNAVQPIGRQRVDLRLGWRATEDMDLSAGVQGLTGGNRVEFPGEAGLVPVRPSAYVRLGVRF